jgi:HD-like signal output (HDOD) protein
MSILSLQQEIEQESNLPVLPPGVSHLFQVLADDKTTYENVAEEIERFPAIAIRVVATANSAWAAPISPITSLRDACSRLGSKLVLSISIALSVSQVFDPSRCPAFKSKKFWVSALLTAEAAYMYAKDTSDVCPDTARLAGLLHNIGLLWLAENRPMEISDAISISENETVSFTQTLQEKYNIDLYDVGGYLAASLELPEAIGSTIASGSTKNIPTDSASTNTSATEAANPLIINHHHARQLAAAVLLHADTIDEDNIDATDSNDDPKFVQLTEKLSGIESMAQALFFA